uniref:Uncharacterized protein n=1 Tax=Panagrolaimus superbus TaxID=310955 RepID=A0A914YZK5_9BILA
MRKPYTSEETFEILPHLKFSNKFRFLILKDVSYFEPIGFCEFLKNILSDETGFVTVLDHEMEKNAKDFAINFVKRELQKFLPDMKFDIH